MEGDTFIHTKNDSIFSESLEKDKNFFLQSDSVFMNVSQPEPVRHLDDYDSNILEDGAYREVSDEVLKLEYKIYRTEEEIKNLEKQIQTANEIHDYYIAQSLSVRKLQLENELVGLTAQYRDTGFSAKISGGITSKLKENFINTKNAVSKLTNSFISKFPSKLSSFLEVKQSLNKLENINKSVDELMKRSYPYGEAGDKYEQISKYIARANAIQSEISRFMK